MFDVRRIVRRRTGDSSRASQMMMRGTCPLLPWKGFDTFVQRSFLVHFQRRFTFTQLTTELFTTIDLFDLQRSVHRPTKSTHFQLKFSLQAQVLISDILFFSNELFHLLLMRLLSVNQFSLEFVHFSSQLLNVIHIGQRETTGRVRRHQRVRSTLI